MKRKNVSISFPAVACNPTLEDGTTPNPFWDDIVLTRVLGIKAPEEEGDQLVFTGITDLQRLNLTKLMELMDGVPVAFPGREIDVTEKLTSLQVMA